MIRLIALFVLVLATICIQARGDPVINYDNSDCIETVDQYDACVFTFAIITMDELSFEMYSEPIIRYYQCADEKELCITRCFFISDRMIFEMILLDYSTTIEEKSTDNCQDFYTCAITWTKVKSIQKGLDLSRNKFIT